MDRLTALIAISQLRSRLDIVKRNPQLLEDIDMVEIKRPIELAGMRSRLARAKKLEADLASTGRRFDQVLDEIDEHHGTLEGHLGHLENEKGQLADIIAGMVDAGSNGGPNDGEDVSGRLAGRPAGRSGHFE